MMSGGYLEKSSSEDSSYFRQATNRLVSRSTMSKKPLPLKQRTSSEDPRRDYSTQTWTSLLGLLKFREFLVTVDHFSIWRRHLAWGMGSGEDLREHMTKRYSTSMVFMSLLLGTELSVLFNSAAICGKVRSALANQEQHTIPFWIGILLILSAVLTLLSLISTLTAWGMVSAIHKENAYAVLRSSIGQYAAELPGRFIVSSIYVFLLWVVLFFFLLMPVGIYSAVLLIFALGMFIHTITAFSSFGRIIMHSGAMGSQRIFDPDFEKSLSPHSLHQHLLTKARVFLDSNISIRRQYGDKRMSFPLRNFCTEAQLAAILADRASDFDFSSDFSAELSSTSLTPESQKYGLVALPQGSSNAGPPPSRPGLNHSNEPFAQGTSPPQSTAPPTTEETARPRANSLVKFSDGFDTSGHRVDTSGHRVEVIGETGHRRTPSNLSVGKSAMKKNPTKEKKGSKSKKPVSIKGTKDPASSGNGGPQPGSTTQVKDKTVSPPTSHVESLAQAAVQAWARQHQPSPTPSGDNVQHSYQQQLQQYQYTSHQMAPPARVSPSSQTGQSLHDKWLAGNYGTIGNGNQPAYTHQQQQLGAGSQPNYFYNYPVQQPPTMHHYGYNHFPPPHQSQHPGYYQPPVSEVPAALTADQRGISALSIPSQVGVPERRDSLVSELDNFQHFQPSDADEDDHVGAYDDKDIDELLDPPSYPTHEHTTNNNNDANPPVYLTYKHTARNSDDMDTVEGTTLQREASNASVMTYSTKNSDDKQGGSLLAGLDIEEGEDDANTNHENGALLKHTEKRGYQSFVDEIKDGR